MSFLRTRIITLLYSFLSTLNAIHIIFSAVFMYSTLNHLFFAPVFDDEYENFVSFRSVCQPQLQTDTS